MTEEKLEDIKVVIISRKSYKTDTMAKRKDKMTNIDILNNTQK